MKQAISKTIVGLFLLGFLIAMCLGVSSCSVTVNITSKPSNKNTMFGYDSLGSTTTGTNSGPFGDTTLNVAYGNSDTHLGTKAFEIKDSASSKPCHFGEDAPLRVEGETIKFIGRAAFQD